MSNENELHKCEGLRCPYIVETNEAWVCSLTGICMEAIFAQGFDDEQCSNNIRLTAEQSGVIKEKATGRPTKANGDIYGECFRVVCKILKKKQASPNASQPDETDVKRATQMAKSVFKKRKGGRFFLFPAAAEFARGLLLSEECGQCDDSFEHLIARRCANSCAFSLATLPKTASAKTGVEYICLATMYMMRQGMQVKGSWVVEPDVRMQAELPSLNALNAFGFKKSKYTKAERFILKAINEAIATRPLHLIKI